MERVEVGISWDRWGRGRVPDRRDRRNRNVIARDREEAKGCPLIRGSNGMRVTAGVGQTDGTGSSKKLGRVKGERYEYNPTKSGGDHHSSEAY